MAITTIKRPKMYMATKDGFFGIKKNDLFAYDKDKILRRTTDAQPIDIDPEVETEFFKAVEVPEGAYKAGDTVVAPKNLEGTVVTSNFPYTTPNSRVKITLPAWTPLEVLGYVGVGIKPTKAEIVLRHAGRTVRVLESKIRISETYFFINSKGDIHGTPVGRDYKADLWCRQNSNYYGSRELAEAAKDKVVAAYDPTPSHDVIHKL